MSIMRINLYGDSILSEKTKPVTAVDDKLIENIRNMFETMKNANGIGLAANQVGLMESFFIIDIRDAEGYEHSKPLVMINPEIIKYSDETDFMEEGCLSIPYIKSEVERPGSVIVKYLDSDENERILEADDLLARVIQHEYDHLQGVVFTERLPSAERRKLKNELLNVQKRNFEIIYPVTEV